MKKNILTTFAFFALVVISSCEEDFDPRTKFKEQYILNCVIRGDNPVQIATLSRSYTISGYDPYENNIDPFFNDADIRLWYKDDVYFLKDTTIARVDTSRYDDSIKCYYLENFTPEANSVLEIRAVLPSGKTLTGVTRFPGDITFVTSESTLFIPPSDKDTILFKWRGNNTGWNVFRFTIYYTKKENGIEVPYTKVVPIKYEFANNIYKPIYPIPSRTPAVAFPNEVMDITMEQISAGDPDKENYRIKNAIIEIAVLDDHLSNYYSSTQGFLDKYTVRVDESDYTNIEGGFGIFGSYFQKKLLATFAAGYVRSFGYLASFD